MTPARAAAATVDSGGSEPAAIDPRARVLIEDFLSDYAHAIDDGEIERWPGFFAEDGIYQIITRESWEAGFPIGIMSCDGRGMMSDRVQALKTANIFEPHTYCHLLERPRLHRCGDGFYAARSNFHVVRTMQEGGQQMFAAGRYLDRIVIDGDGPKFRERRVVLDSRRVDILLVLPL